MSPTAAIPQAAHRDPHAPYAPPPPVPLPTLLARAAAGPGQVHFWDRHGAVQRHSYAALHAAAQNLAELLHARGLRRGQRVALVLPTGPAFYHALFAAQLLGAIVAPLYPPVRLARLDDYLGRTEAMLRQIDAALVVTTPALAGLLAPALLGARPALGHVALETPTQAPASAAAPQAAATAPQASPTPAAAAAFTPSHVDDVALLQFSSGTTGNPKAVALTHRQIHANVATIARALYVGAPPRRPDGCHATVSWLPLYHDMGLMGCVLTSLYDGTDVTLLAPEDFVGRPVQWLRALSQTRASVSAAPNFAYALCCTRIAQADVEGLDLSAWQVALNGAEGVSAATMDAFAARFGPCGFAREALTPVYGLAEAVLAVSFANPQRAYVARRFAADDLRRHRRAVPWEGDAAAAANGSDDAATDEGPPAATTLVSVGRPLPGYAMRVVRPRPEDDDNGDAAAAAGATGRTNVASVGHGHDDDRTCADGEVGALHVAGPSLMAGYWPVAVHQPPPAEAPPGQPARWLDTGDLGFVYEGALYVVGRQQDTLVVRGHNYAPDDLERAADAVAEVRTGCSVAFAVRRPNAATDAVVLLVEVRDRSLWAVPADADRHAELRRRLTAAVAQATGLRLDEVALLAPGTLPRTSSGKKRRAEAKRRYLAGALTPPPPLRRWRLLLRALRGRLKLWRARRAGRGGSSPAGNPTGPAA